MVAIQFSSGKTITVCMNCEVSTLKEAIELAADGDVILVKSGTYNESNLIIMKSITIKGENQPVVDGQRQGEIFRIGADGVTLDGLTVKNVGKSYTTDFAAIRIVESKNFVIKNMVLEEPFFGIYLQKSHHGKILNNKVIGSAKSEFDAGNAIHLWYCTHIEINGNHVQGVRDGIYLEFSDDVLIKNNYSKGNVRYGLHFMFSNNDVYENNIFESNDAGVAVMYSKGIDMHYNTFKENWGSASYGLLLKEISDSKITHNTFRNNTVGITAEGGNRVEFTHNDFISNGWAVKVKGACYYNIYTNNNFLYNSFDLAYDGGMNQNKFENNYWSDYTGYDLDRDGIGDVPYRPVKLFSYVVNRVPEGIILLRSIFTDLLDFSEKVSPVFTPDKLMDEKPRMKKIDHDRN